MSQFDQESIVYGIIKNVPPADLEAYKQSRTNQKAIQMLPSSLDFDFPLLCREMFSMSGGDSDDIFSGTYHTQIIHFAASYRAIEYEWESWIGKFEEVLRSMYWMSATVHLETELSGKHTFNWVAHGAGHRPTNDELKMVCEWEREFSFAGRI